jgi:predicted phosphodiesterase
MSLSKLKGNELSDCIAQLISECAAEEEIDPREVNWKIFQKYLKEQEVDVGSVEVGKAGGFKVIHDAYFPPVPTKASVEISRVKEHARLNRKLGAQAVREQFLAESIESFSERVFKGRIQPFSISRLVSPQKKTQRVVNAVLSDLHFGADLRAEETGDAYGKIEEARRAAAVFEQIMEYKIEHRSETELELLILGDIIQGQLHDPRDGAELAEQVCRAIHILSQGVAYLASGYKKVRVRCATGNHGRNKARHEDRATHQKWDSHETILYYSIKQACAALKNVEFFIPRTPFVTYEVFGQKVFATHGDTVINVSNPGAQIRVRAIENQVNRINASLNDRDEYSVFVLGHVHTGTITHLSNGSTVITNGALIPQDSFAVSIGLLETKCGQWIWESVPGFPVGDSRFIKVGREHDSNAKLDKIIQPWSSL